MATVVTENETGAEVDVMHMKVMKGGQLFLGSFVLAACHFFCCAHNGVTVLTGD